MEEIYISIEVYWLLVGTKDIEYELVWARACGTKARTVGRQQTAPMIVVTARRTGWQIYTGRKDRNKGRPGREMKGMEGVR